MLNMLYEVCQTGGQFRGVLYSHFPGEHSEPSIVTAVGLSFERMTITIRAVADDDTLSVSATPVAAETDEVLVDWTHSSPWAECVGREATWAWLLRNQQGYTDGVRFEFRSSNEPAAAIVELIVIASKIEIFTSTRCS